MKKNGIQLTNTIKIADGNGFYFRATLIWNITERESKTISVNNSYLDLIVMKKPFPSTIVI